MMNIVRCSVIGSTHFTVQSHVLEFVIIAQKSFCFFYSGSVFIIVNRLLLVMESDLDQGEAHRISTFQNILVQILYIS